VSAALASACARPPVGYAHPEASGVLIITRQEAARHDLKPATLSVSYDGERDESHALVAYLEEARRRGATYVSDVAFLTVRDDGSSTEECRTAVYPDEQIVDQKVPASYRFVTCARPVTRPATDFRSYPGVPASRGCPIYRASHLVTNYEFNTDWQLVPEHVETVPMQRLKQNPPVCHALRAGGAPLPDHRIEGIAYASTANAR
jgi:hypothetical protein